MLHLRNGDRLTGTLISQSQETLVLSNTWCRQLTIPASAVEKQEPAPPPPAAESHAPMLAASTNHPPSALAGKNRRRLRFEARIGTDSVIGTKSMQNYFGRAKLTYERQYQRNATEYFRSALDYLAEYGNTDDQIGANKMWGSSKTDFDIGKKWFAYNLGAAGFDQVRKIDLHWEIGPGLGYHLVHGKKFALDAELGGSYMNENRTDHTEVQRVYLRIGETLAWKLGERLKLTESGEFLQQTAELDQFRVRLESNLAYVLTDHLSLNLTLIDIYDTDPANGVEPNEMQIRSSLGVTF